MKRLAALACLLLAVGCSPAPAPPTVVAARLTQGDMSLADARAMHVTKLTRKEKAGEPVPRPPAGVLDLVSFKSPVGSLAAYLSPKPKDGARHPAIIWITGGDHATIGDVWSPADRDNDQTASAFRNAGIVIMYPSQRGGNDNPGFHEGFYGEVTDISAAYDYLSKLEYVDPARIYLGGHSTGGTLALLVAETDSRFRATFSFGPVSDPRHYGDDMTPFDTTDKVEAGLRMPILWLGFLKTPTFVIEGQDRPSNASDVRAMGKTNTNPKVQFFVVSGANHFGVLGPVSELLARKILADTGAMTNITVTMDELRNAVK